MRTPNYRLSSRRSLFASALLASLAGCGCGCGGGGGGGFSLSALPPGAACAAAHTGGRSSIQPLCHEGECLFLKLRCKKVCGSRRASQPAHHRPVQCGADESFGLLFTQASVNPHGRGHAAALCAAERLSQRQGHRRGAVREPGGDHARGQLDQRGGGLAREVVSQGRSCHFALSGRHNMGPLMERISDMAVRRGLLVFETEFPWNEGTGCCRPGAASQPRIRGATSSDEIDFADPCEDA